VDVLSNPATLPLQTKAATSLLSVSLGKSFTGRQTKTKGVECVGQTQYVWHCTFQNSQRNGAHIISQIISTHILEVSMLQSFCSASKLVPTFGDTSREYCIRSQTWNYYHAFVTTLLKGIELVCQEWQFTTPLKNFLLRRDCSCVTHVNCIFLVARTISGSIDGGIPRYSAIIFLKN